MMYSRLSAVLFLVLSAAVAADSIPIRVQPLGELLRRSEFSAPATVEPLNAPSLAAEISARIQAIPVRIGDRIRRGEVLVELDCRYHRSRLQAAQAGLQRLDAQLRFADDQLKRAVDLQSKRSISEELLDQRRMELRVARAERENQQELIRQAEIDVERCTITAPFDAVVVERLAQVGGLAGPGTPLLELVQLDDLEVSAELRGAEAIALQRAEHVGFDYAGKHYPLHLRQLLPVVDARTRTQEARLSFTGDSAPVGAAGRLVWRGAANELAADYLVRRDSRLGIFLEYDGQAHFQVLDNAREGQPVRLQLPPTSRLITDGRQRLQDGDAVTILKE